MEISAIDQEVSDYDWFAIDSKGNIGHFASNGGILPESIAASAEDLQLIVDHFKSSQARTGFRLAPTFSYPPDIKSAEQKKIFVSSFVAYSECGLYSFDRYEPNYRGDLSKQNYIPVSQPNNPILVNQLPETIQIILSKVICNCNFHFAKTIDLAEFQNR
jgi:hypothetical protein